MSVHNNGGCPEDLVISFSEVDYEEIGYEKRGPRGVPANPHWFCERTGRNLRAELSIKTIPLRFIVVNAQASYNIILGRPALNQLRAIVSTPYLCKECPIGERVGTIRADQ
ncbi:hypothetical protein CR513_23931, partial [Mucuna pruriens]